MDKNIFVLLAKYNKKANEKMNEIIKTLSEEEWNKQFTGFFKSIHELCSHIYGGDRRWLARLNADGKFKSLSNEIIQAEHDPKKLFFESINEYLTKRVELDNIIINFIDEIYGSDLDNKIKWKNAKGVEFTHTLGTGIIHLSHHETHHRGMISLYLEFLGKENDYSNLYIYE